MHWQQKENPGGAVPTQLLEFLPFLSGIYVDSKSGTKWMHSSLNASLGADGTPQLAAPSIHPSHGRVSWEGLGLLSHFQGLQGNGSFQHHWLFCCSTTILGYYYSSKLAH